MKELNTEIVINASAEKVWDVLTDFDSYDKWNPFIKILEGKPELGTRLKIFVQPSGTRGMGFKPKVLKVESGRELRWLGSILVSGIFDGEHIFVIEPIDANTVRFTQSEKFTGLLVPIFWRSIDTDTRRGFHEMNAALKKRAEEADRN